MPPMTSSIFVSVTESDRARATNRECACRDDAVLSQLAYGEDIVQDVQHLPGRRSSDPQQVVRLSVKRVIQHEDVEDPHEAAERRAQLVAHGCQEALQRVRVLHLQQSHQPLVGEEQHLHVLQRPLLGTAGDAAAVRSEGGARLQPLVVVLGLFVSVPDHPFLFHLALLPHEDELERGAVDHSDARGSDATGGNGGGAQVRQFARHRTARHYVAIRRGSRRSLRGEQGFRRRADVLLVHRGADTPDGVEAAVGPREVRVGGRLLPKRAAPFPFADEHAIGLRALPNDFRKLENPVLTERRGILGGLAAHVFQHGIHAGQPLLQRSSVMRLDRILEQHGGDGQLHAHARIDRERLAVAVAGQESPELALHDDRCSRRSSDAHILEILGVEAGDSAEPGVAVVHGQARHQCRFQADLLGGHGVHHTKPVALKQALALRRHIVLGEADAEEPLEAVKVEAVNGALRDDAAAAILAELVHHDPVVAAHLAHIARHGVAQVAHRVHHLNLRHQLAHALQDATRGHADGGVHFFHLHDQQTGVAVLHVCRREEAALIVPCKRHDPPRPALLGGPCHVTGANVRIPLRVAVPALPPHGHALVTLSMSVHALGQLLLALVRLMRNMYCALLRLLEEPVDLRGVGEKHAQVFSQESAPIEGHAEDSARVSGCLYNAWHSRAVSLHCHHSPHILNRRQQMNGLQLTPLVHVSLRCRHLHLAALGHVLGIHAVENRTLLPSARCTVCAGRHFSAWLLARELWPSELKCVIGLERRAGAKTGIRYILYLGTFILKYQKGCPVGSREYRV
eukprot:scaffold10_cov257-Pinguiococcus_pyrenoidosus.AAC.25